MICPDITILLVTWNRPVEIRKTVYGLVKHIRYDGNIKWHLADDNSPDSYVYDIIHEFRFIPEWSYSITDRKGWGANVNQALKGIETEYVFLIEDDYVCNTDLDFNAGVEVLESQSDVVCIRYDGIAGHSLNLKLRETSTKIQYMAIDFDSPHLNVYSNRPHLRKHKQMLDDYGYYDEGIKLGLTEESFAHKVKDTKKGKFAILWDGVLNKFDHIGISRQGGEHDNGGCND